MPLGKLRQDYVPLPAAKPQPQLSSDAGPITAAPSPARALQEQLERSHAAATAASVEKWSPRRAVAFIVTASLALWMTILIAGAQVTRAVA